MKKILFLPLVLLITFYNQAQNKMNNELMGLLRTHVESMNINFEDKKLTKYIYENIKNAKKESKNIQVKYLRSC